jgi:hypothetical protein
MKEDRVPRGPDTPIAMPGRILKSMEGFLRKEMEPERVSTKQSNNIPTSPRLSLLSDQSVGRRQYAVSSIMKY